MGHSQCYSWLVAGSQAWEKASLVLPGGPDRARPFSFSCGSCPASGMRPCSPWLGPSQHLLSSLRCSVDGREAESTIYHHLCGQHHHGNAQAGKCHCCEY
ncbi:hypothetical protein EYF80_006701 [Liparis tanakae]|uniref:Uncharacterized protein n=1 Tax=Liparis tanakae TaxID=230148 RepID=A0A4Z2IZU1_9TELE|nr:hypothetical protein EYF80_006701 [Liparis tanakae]